MSLRVTIEAFGEEQFAREILRFSERVDDMRPAFDAIRDRFYDQEKQQFDTQGAAGPSGAWAPLAQTTIDRKRAAGLLPNILQATGRLKSSLTGQGDDAVYRPLTDDVFFGSTVEYGVYHQSTAARSKLPRRPPVDIPDAEKRQWMKVLQKFLVTGEA